MAPGSFLPGALFNTRRAMRPFTDTERKILRLAQGSLPDSTTPYADIARMVSLELRQEQGENAPQVSEREILDLLSELKDNGAIRRFGATLRHQKAGYGGNVMVAWKCPEELVEACGEKMATHQMVSHCYYRLGTEDWPYVIYTMVHGKSREDCLNTVEELAALSGLSEPATLFSIRELKKTSMTYF